MKDTCQLLKNGIFSFAWQGSLCAVFLVCLAVNSASAQSKGDILIQTKFIEIGSEFTMEIGFDWLLGVTPPLGAEEQEEKATPNKKNRKRPGTIVSSTYEIENEPVMVTGDDGVPYRGDIPMILGVFTDPQFKMIERSLAQEGNIELDSAASVRARDGEPANIQIVRPDLKPLELPPEVLEAIEERNFGVELMVEAKVGIDKLTIDLTLTPEVIGFEGFINYGSREDNKEPIPDAGDEAAIDLGGNQIVLPVFKTQKEKTRITLWDGQTVAIGGVVREDVFAVEERLPLLGDIPLLGRVFRKEKHETVQRNLVMFVTAKLVE